MTSIHLLCRGHTFAPISLDNSSFPFRGFCAFRKFLPFLSCFLKLKSLRLIRGNKKKRSFVLVNPCEVPLLDLLFCLTSLAVHVNVLFRYSEYHVICICSFPCSRFLLDFPGFSLLYSSLLFPHFSLGLL